MKIAEYFEHKFKLKNEITRKDLIGTKQTAFTASQIDTEIKRQMKAGTIERVSKGVYKRIVDISIEQQALDAKEIAKHIKRSQKRAKRITRKHKLYVRGWNDEIRRLDKISPEIYGQIILLFLQGKGEDRYALLNKGTEHWSDLKGISMPLDLKDEGLFKKLQKVLKDTSKRITVYYNGSWKPLVEVHMYVPEAQMEEKI